MKNPKESFIQHHLETRHPNSPKDPPRYSNALEVFEQTRKRHETQAEERETQLEIKNPLYHLKTEHPEAGL